MPMMPWTRILVEAPGLRPTASAALKPTRPTPMAAPRQPRPPWRLPVSSARTWVMLGLSLWLECRRPRSEHGPDGKALVRAVAVVVGVMIVPVIADEPDVDA